MNDLSSRFAAVVNGSNVFAGDAIEPRYTLDALNGYSCEPSYVLRPRSTAEVVEIVKIARDARIPITPLGGRTGLVGGGVCGSGGIILSLELMNKIIEIDESAMTLSVEAGATVQSVQEAAEARGLLMPLDLASRGTATIGGAIATNAGGVRVLRWGMMRDMIIGLEAVLANGSVVSRRGKMLKDNAGYDWKQLMIGSEGTLGIVTQANLRLRPLPTTSQTALIAMDTIEQADRALRQFQLELGGQLSSFELLWNNFYSFVSHAQASRRAPPMSAEYPFYALVESLGANVERDEAVFEEVLAAMLESGLIRDVVIAQSERQRQNLWALRDDTVEAFGPLGPMLGLDISIPLLEMDRFAEQTTRRIHRTLPDALVFHFGHAGDGNLHVVVSEQQLADRQITHGVESIIYEAVGELGGSISAEHCIGQKKLDFLHHSRSQEEIALMACIKQALDPLNLLNPGMVIPPRLMSTPN